MDVFITDDMRRRWAREDEEWRRQSRRHFWLTSVLLGVLVGCLFWLITLRVRAEPAMFACEAKRMDYRRRTLSTEVVCVPKTLDTRNDTLTIQPR